jgi:hypothetical protein
MAQKKVCGMYNFYALPLCFYSLLRGKVTDPTNGTPLLLKLATEDKPEAILSSCYFHNHSLLRCFFILSSHFILVHLREHFLYAALSSFI